MNPSRPSNRPLWILLVALAAGIGIQVVQRRSAAAGALDYRPSWAEACAEAERVDKPILLNFGGPW